MNANSRRRVYLLRHADVAYYADPARPVVPEEVVLTSAGLDQARAVGKALAKVRLDRVLTSGLPRTIETARLVLAELQHPPRDPVLQHWPELQEYRLGDVSQIPDSELTDAFLGPFRGTPHPATAYLRGETVGSLLNRVSVAIERLYADPSWQTMLVVGHGGVNRAILSWVIAGNGQFYAQFEQSPGCINIIDGEPSSFVVRAVNATPCDVAHLGSRLTAVEQIVEEYRSYRASPGHANA
jgi:broad specificity phosphatase PhoE